MTTASEIEALIQLNLVISKPCGLVNFINILAEMPHVTTWVKDWYFRQSFEGREQDKVLISEYQQVMVDTGPSHCDEIGTCLNFNEKAMSIAADCKTIDELLLKIKGVLEIEKYNRLKRIIDYFEPIYERLVWEPRLEELQRQVEKAHTLALQSRLNERLGSVRKFMRAPWVPGLPITVCFLPLPLPDIDDPRIHGQCLGRVQLIELMPGKKSKQAQLDVVFHEACHALWETRSDKETTVKADFEKVDGAFAYAELNEGMATALGQGWFYKLAFGKGKRKWYLDAIIDRYAKALYALIIEYVEGGKEMDEEFALRATKIFKKRFPKFQGRTTPIP
jgi:hypothetical protein